MKSDELRFGVVELNCDSMQVVSSSTGLETLASRVALAFNTLSYAQTHLLHMKPALFRSILF